MSTDGSAAAKADSIDRTDAFSPCTTAPSSTAVGSFATDRGPQVGDEAVERTMGSVSGTLTSSCDLELCDKVVWSSSGSGGDNISTSGSVLSRLALHGTLLWSSCCLGCLPSETFIDMDGWNCPREDRHTESTIKVDTTQSRHEVRFHEQDFKAKTGTP
ncbi:MAG: hypothetical protein JKY23_00320 [Nitrospinaceae bacterium]|nr:hypothetical protein [Nitrospinaceae bacterium]